VWGFSQGGWVAPMAAGLSGKVAFAIMVSGAAVSPQEQSNQAVALRLQEAGIEHSIIEAVIRHLRSVWSKVNAGGTLTELADVYARVSEEPWAKETQKLTMDFEIDAAASLKRLRIPVLAIFGDKDESVPQEKNVPLLADYLASSPSGDYTISVLSEANHQLMIGNDYHPLYISSMINWVASRFLSKQ